MLQSVSAATDLDLISFLKAIPDARMRRGIRIPAWYLLLVAVLGILSKRESLRDLERFARRHHGVLAESLCVELKRPPSDSAFRYFFLQDVASICAAIRDWTLAQIKGGVTDLDQLVCYGKMLRASIEATAVGGSAFIAQVTLYSAALGLPIAQGCYATNRGNEHAELKKLLGELDLGGVLIQADALHTHKAFSAAHREGGRLPAERQRQRNDPLAAGQPSVRGEAPYPFNRNASRDRPRP